MKMLLEEFHEGRLVYGYRWYQSVMIYALDLIG